MLIFHNIAPSHRTRFTLNYLEALNWKILPHTAYLSHLALSHYHLFLELHDFIMVSDCV